MHYVWIVGSLEGTPCPVGAAGGYPVCPVGAAGGYLVSESLRLSSQINTILASESSGDLSRNAVCSMKLLESTHCVLWGPLEGSPVFCEAAGRSIENRKNP